MKIYELYELSVEHKDLSLDHFSIENIGNIFNSLENISERYSIEDETEQNNTSSQTVRRTGFAKVITNVVWFFQRAYTFFVELIRKFRIWLASKSIKRAISELDKKPDIRYTAITGVREEGGSPVTQYRTDEQYRIDRNILFLLVYFRYDNSSNIFKKYLYLIEEVDEYMTTTPSEEMKKSELEVLIEKWTSWRYCEKMIKKYIASVCSKSKGDFEFEKRPGVSRKYRKRKDLHDKGHLYDREMDGIMYEVKEEIHDILKYFNARNSDEYKYLKELEYRITGDTIKKIANNLLNYLKQYEKLSSTMCNKLKELRLSRIGDENYRNYVILYKGIFSKIQKFIRADMETGFLCVKALNRLVNTVLKQDSVTDDNSLTL